MVGVLRKGSEELEKLIENANKLTDKQIEKLAEANVTLEKWGRNIKIYSVDAAEGVGKIVNQGFLFDLARFMGAMKGGAGWRESRDIAFGLNQVEKEASKAVEAVEELKEVKGLTFKQDFEEENAINRLLNAERERVETAKELLGIKMRTTQQDRDSAFNDMSSFSLEELANVQGWLSGKAFQQRAMAQRSLFLQSEAKRARLWGEDGIAEDLTQRSLDIRKNIGALSDSERNPFARMDESLMEINRSMLELLNRADTVGIKIDPINGQ